MEKKYWLINVVGNHGYSFMVCGELEDEDEAIDAAFDEDLFESADDANYATAEEADENDIKHFTEGGYCYEIY